MTDACIVCVCYLKQQRASTAVCLLSEQQSRCVDKQWPAQPEPASEPSSWDPTSPARISGLLYGNWKKNKLKKKIINQKERTLTLAASKKELSVRIKQQNKKGKKKQKKKEKTEKLSICSENQRRLPHWLFPFVILIVLMTPKIPKIPFSVRSAFCLCSFMIWTLLSDIWYVQPQLRHPKETMMYAKGAVTLERDIFCVSGLCLLPPPPPPPPTCSGCKSGCCCHWIL